MGRHADGVTPYVSGLQRTAALSTALELNFFTSIAEGHATCETLADRCHTTVRGTRVLCNYLTLLGFLEKKGTRYELTAASTVLVDGRVRDGDRDVEFARVMGPVMTPVADRIARLAGATGMMSPRRVLDVAAGHGVFGIAMARQHPHAQIVAVDRPRVLAVAQRHAAAAGVAARYRCLSGDMLELDFGTGYDIVLLGDLVDRLDATASVCLLTKACAALSDGGRVIVLGGFPDEPRRATAVVSAHEPIGPAVKTPHSLADVNRMLAAAGLRRRIHYALPPTDQRAIIAERADDATRACLG